MILINKKKYGLLAAYFVTALLSFTISAKEQTSMAATAHIEKVVLGAGCFWGAEKRYQNIPGVIDAVSGYADGNVAANYRTITQAKYKNDPNNHAEVVEVTFNSNEISLTKILESFFEGHDPTQLNRQGNDIGTQYRSTILTTSPQQLSIAQAVKTRYQTLLSQAGYGEIKTNIKPLETFFPAENYHQDYLVKNPNGYCPDHSTGVKFAPSTDEKSVRQNAALLQGKHIVIVESAGYCPYCEKLKKDVLNDYQGSIALHFRFANELDGLNIQTPTWATPTILFIEDGQEVMGRQGYLDSAQFYRLLGLFKLGKSEAFNVAFDEGTDGRFCKEYEIFKNTPDGVFIDKLSGAPLFDTKDRFNSGTGWLSFTQAVPDSVIERADNRFGMQRVELRSKTSGIHLGHVFEDGPNGARRFCINATVLEFVARKNID
ncbi:peptide-methionine (S)-S-oxide reductase MsrA [Pseudoalteromonas tunicata]|uniref:peptide-methionine (S)-S-oxide reductase MsrA n=1 Tax=Pseudoalteromonas tunicata TaxID=314281 RepID=UPI00273FA6E1|nr:peptide-methionine (S)-S-oxide reductase MsrA [Pseudoalteromonas tunicata]MDP4983433.1 peptide-methionine (S)-S-oxide reductase MsrA [Pseudoalteromonas tunicata]